MTVFRKSTGARPEFIDAPGSTSVGNAEFRSCTLHRFARNGCRAGTACLRYSYDHARSIHVVNRRPLVHEADYVRIVDRRKRRSTRRTLLGFLFLAVVWASVREWLDDTPGFSAGRFALEIPYRATIIVVVWFGVWVALYSAARMYAIWRLIGDWRRFLGAYRVMTVVRMSLDGAVSLRFTFGALTVVVAALIALYWRFPNHLNLAFVISAASWYVTIAAMATPPAVLLLSTSTKDNIALQSVLSELIIPLGVFSLLRLDQADEKATELVGPHCVRVHNDRDWLTVIKVLIKTVPYVVLDSRNITNPVEHEVEYVLTNGLTYKVLFVSNDEHRCPAVTSVVERTGTPLPRDLCLVSETHLYLLLPMLTKARQLPSPAATTQLLVGVQYLKMAAAAREPSRH